MSRDRVLDLPGEGARRPVADSTPPRGGRGSGKRAGQPMPRDPRDVLAAKLELPRGEVRERVWSGRTGYELRNSDVRTLAAVGAFRVVDVRDLQGDRHSNWHGDVEHLRRAGLVAVSPRVLDGARTQVVTLTPAGRALLERHQRAEEPRQSFYAGMVKPREIPHDAKLYRAFSDAATRLQRDGARVERVLLDYELKREYQRFLQANNRGKAESSGRPDRSAEEIKEWASAHQLTVVNGHVQFPDVRIEYERPDGQSEREDIELATEHYNARQMAAKRAAGFTMGRSAGSRLRGSSARSGATPFDPHAVEEVLR
ncbi:MAG: hypothetical protein AB7I36_18970 [Rhodospirillaceae bacterium]